jgi:hypothetical protein
MSSITTTNTNNNNNKKEETRIAKLYETVIQADEKEEEFVLPTSVTKDRLVSFVEGMIKSSQPRHLRKEGRVSHSLSDYRIPVNYFIVDSNTVPYNSSTGYLPSIINNYVDVDNLLETELVEDDQEGFETIKVVQKEEEQFNPVTKALQELKKFREDDLGVQIVLHIFKHGRKTIDELIQELTGLDKYMLTIIVNKLIKDGYLRICMDDLDDKSGEKIKTLEVVEINR